MQHNLGNWYGCMGMYVGMRVWKIAVSGIWYVRVRVRVRVHLRAYVRVRVRVRVLCTRGPSGLLQKRTHQAKICG